MIDGVMVRLDEDIELAKTQMHTIKVVIDRVTVKEENKDRIAQDVEKGLKESFGELEVEVINHEEVGTEKYIHYSEQQSKERFENHQTEQDYSEWEKQQKQEKKNLQTEHYQH